MFLQHFCIIVLLHAYVQLLWNECNFCSTCGHKTSSKLTDSVSLQLQDSICEKDIIWNYFQDGYCYEVIFMFLRLFCNINISKWMLERRVSYYGFRRRRFSNVTINELKSVMQFEIQRPTSMCWYRELWHSLKVSYGIIVRLCIKTGIQERGMKSGERRE